MKDWFIQLKKLPFLSVYLIFYRESICMNCLFHLALLTKSVSLHYFQIRFEMLTWHFVAFFLTWSVQIKNEMAKFVIVNDNTIFRQLFFLETKIIAIKSHMRKQWKQKFGVVLFNEVLVRIIFCSSRSLLKFILSTRYNFPELLWSSVMYSWFFWLDINTLLLSQIKFGVLE